MCGEGDDDANDVIAYARGKNAEDALQRVILLIPLQLERLTV